METVMRLATGWGAGFELQKGLDFLEWYIPDLEPTQLLGINSPFVKDRKVKQINHFNLIPGLRCVQLFFHSPYIDLFL